MTTPIEVWYKPSSSDVDVIMVDAPISVAALKQAIVLKEKLESSSSKATLSLSRVAVEKLKETGVIPADLFDETDTGDSLLLDAVVDLTPEFLQELSKLAKLPKAHRHHLIFEANTTAAAVAAAAVAAPPPPTQQRQIWYKLTTANLTSIKVVAPLTVDALTQAIFIKEKLDCSPSMGSLCLSSEMIAAMGLTTPRALMDENGNKLFIDDQPTTTTPAAAAASSTTTSTSEPVRRLFTLNPKASLNDHFLRGLEEVNLPVKGDHHIIIEVKELPSPPHKARKTQQQQHCLDFTTPEQLLSSMESFLADPAALAAANLTPRNPTTGPLNRLMPDSAQVFDDFVGRENTLKDCYHRMFKRFRPAAFTRAQAFHIGAAGGPGTGKSRLLEAIAQPKEDIVRAAVAPIPDDVAEPELAMHREPFVASVMDWVPILITYNHLTHPLGKLESDPEKEFSLRLLLSHFFTITSDSLMGLYEWMTSCGPSTWHVPTILRAIALHHRKHHSSATDSTVPLSIFIGVDEIKLLGDKATSIVHLLTQTMTEFSGQKPGDPIVFTTITTLDKVFHANPFKSGSGTDINYLTFSLLPEDAVSKLFDPLKHPCFAESAWRRLIAEAHGHARTLSLIWCAAKKSEFASGHNFSFLMQLVCSGYVEEGMFSSLEFSLEVLQPALLGMEIPLQTEVANQPSLAPGLFGGQYFNTLSQTAVTAKPLIPSIPLLRALNWPRSTPPSAAATSSSSTPTTTDTQHVKDYVCGMLGVEKEWSSGVALEDLVIYREVIFPTLRWPSKAAPHVEMLATHFNTATGNPTYMDYINRLRITFHVHQQHLTKTTGYFETCSKEDFAVGNFVRGVHGQPGCEAAQMVTAEELDATDNVTVKRKFTLGVLYEAKYTALESKPTFLSLNDDVMPKLANALYQMGLGEKPKKKNQAKETKTEEKEKKPKKPKKQVVKKCDEIVLVFFAARGCTIPADQLPPGVLIISYKDNALHNWLGDTLYLPSRFTIFDDEPIPSSSTSTSPAP